MWTIVMFSNVCLKQYSEAKEGPGVKRGRVSQNVINVKY